jgi:hypothetical protein
MIAKDLAPGMGIKAFAIMEEAGGSEQYWRPRRV